MKKIYQSVVVLLLSVISVNAQSNITWNGVGKDIANNSLDNRHPRIALDGAGNPLVIWGRMSDESVFFSRWDGTMFTTPVKLNPSWLTVSMGSYLAPEIASKGDTVYVVVKRTPETVDTNRIFIFTSFNGGVSFNPPVELAFIADSVSSYPSVTTDATGNPIVTFMKSDQPFVNPRWVVTKSSDYGNTFSTDVKASGQSGGEVCDCCPATILSSGSNIITLYRSNIGNIRDIWAGISPDYGNTFPLGLDLDQNNWQLFACPTSGPDAEIIGDTLYTVFMNGASGSGRIYLSKTSISSGSVNSIDLLTSAIPGLNQQNFPRMAANGNAVAIVWKQNVNGTDQLPLLFTNDITKGFPALYDTVDSKDINIMDVALSNGNIFVVWEDFNTKTVKYRTGTFTPSTTTGINEFSQNNFSVYPNPAVTEIKIDLFSKDNFEIEIINTRGKTVLKTKNKTVIDVSKFSTGTYFIIVREGNNAYSQKFIKQ